MYINALAPKIYPSESTELQAQFTERKCLAAELAAVDKNILMLAVKTPAYAFLKGIASGGNVGGGDVTNDFIVFNISAHSLDARNIVPENRPLSKPYEPSLMDTLGKETINSMLNNKLLSEAERRRLLTQILPAGILDKPAGE